MIEQRRRWLPVAAHAALDIYRAQGKLAWVRAQGSSMRPSIAPGAQLLVDFGAAPEQPGAIVLFRQGQRVVAHRVVARQAERGALIAKGDFEAFCDAPIELSDLLGVVRAQRSGPQRPISRALCAGWPARSIARISWWSGRGAARMRRRATVLPGPLRPVALHAIVPLARVVALAIFMPIVWVAQIQALIKRTKGGDW